MNEFDLKIIELVSVGKTNAEIADDIGYSEVNVKKRLQKLFKNFNVKNRSSLAYIWLSRKNKSTD